MQALLELATLLAFIVAYYLRGLYAATAVLMAAMGVLLLIDLVRERRIPSMHALSALLVWLFGSATLLLHNRLYIQWKPTVFFWLVSAAFLASFWIGERTLAERLLARALEPTARVPAPVWRRLNGLWVAFAAALGAANLAVAYHASERAWVNFKVIGVTLATALFVAAQTAWLLRRSAPAVGGPGTAADYRNSPTDATHSLSGR